MSHSDYTDVRAFLHDEDLVNLLSADATYPQLLERFLVDDFLAIDPSMKVPFFAEVRDYLGAVEKRDPQHHWIVKQVSEEDALGAAMGSVCFFLDFFARTVSAPTVVTRIDGKLCKAAKIITRAEQLTGASYAEIPQLREQLALDLVNRWIYCDEDRNPNNYIIRSTSRGDQVVIAINFSNVDLLFPGTKIKGRADSFGWEKIEKTRCLSPLKMEQFQGYTIEFFDMRLDAFARVGRKMLMDLCKECLRFQPDHAALAKTITDNLLKRIEYVRDYFGGHFPKHGQSPEKGNHRNVGSAAKK
ncbi:MAG TPA: hypothetical protein VMU36_10855 [Spirochaetia bacterium]|nr:hypothetical protein [Spirochaetia bacterium]